MSELAETKEKTPLLEDSSEFLTKYERTSIQLVKKATASPVYQEMRKVHNRPNTLPHKQSSQESANFVKRQESTKSILKTPLSKAGSVNVEQPVIQTGKQKREFKNEPPKIEPPKLEKVTNCQNMPKIEVFSTGSLDTNTARSQNHI